MVWAATSEHVDVVVRGICQRWIGRILARGRKKENPVSDGAGPKRAGARSGDGRERELPDLGQARGDAAFRFLEPALRLPAGGAGGVRAAAQEMDRRSDLHVPGTDGPALVEEHARRVHAFQGAPPVEKERHPVPLVLGSQDAAVSAQLVHDPFFQLHRLLQGCARKVPSRWHRVKGNGVHPDLTVLPMF